MADEYWQMHKDSEAQGWRWTKTIGNHWIGYSPDGKVRVTHGSTPSDHRAYANTLAQMRRAGYVDPVRQEQASMNGRGATVRQLTAHAPNVKHWCQVCKEKVRKHADGTPVGDGLLVHIKCSRRWNKIQRALRAAEARAAGFSVPVKETLVDGKPAQPLPVIPNEVTPAPPSTLDATDRDLLYSEVEELQGRVTQLEAWVTKVQTAFGALAQEGVPLRQSAPPPKPVPAPTPPPVKAAAAPPVAKPKTLTKDEQRRLKIGRFKPRPNQAVAGGGGLPLTEHVYRLVQGHLTDGVTADQMTEWLYQKGVKPKNKTVVAVALSLLYREGRIGKLRIGHYVQK